MSAGPVAGYAADRLARTRLAIIEHVQHAQHGSPRPASHEGNGMPGQDEHGRWTSLKAGAQAWWENHPARRALKLAEPAIAAYARHRPVRLLALCAAAGALLVLARPWRLISITGVLMAAIRSPQLSSAALSVFLADRRSADEPSPPARRSP